MTVIEIPCAVPTAAPLAQVIERRIQRAWRIYRRVRDTPAGCARLRRPVTGIVSQVHDLEVSFDDWQILNRQALELERAVRAVDPVLTGDGVGFDDITAVDTARAARHRVPDPMELPTRKQIQLARAAADAPAAPLATGPRALARRLVTSLAIIALADLLSISFALPLARGMSVWAFAVMVGAPAVGIAVAATIIWSPGRLDRARLARALSGLARLRPLAALRRRRAADQLAGPRAARRPQIASQPLR